MMLIVGGRAQGKLSYALSIQRGEVTQGENCPLDLIPNHPIFSGLHQFVRRCQLAGQDPWPPLKAYLEQNPSAILICDEVGGGIVPVDAKERQWREAVGRICCELARRAQRVDRVCCGLPLTIKGRGEGIC